MSKSILAVSGRMPSRGSEPCEDEAHEALSAALRTGSQRSSLRAGVRVAERRCERLSAELRIDNVS